MREDEMTHDEAIAYGLELEAHPGMIASSYRVRQAVIVLALAAARQKNEEPSVVTILNSEYLGKG